jgi:hypothetical protein
VGGTQKSAGTILTPISDAFEQRYAGLTACNGFPVDDAGPGAQARQGLDDQRQALGQVVAGAAVELHARAVLIPPTLLILADEVVE